MIQYVFFDFGGTLDAPGFHTRTLFWEAFLQHGLVTEGQRPEFQEAYTKADQKMMETGIAKNLGLRNFNRMNGTLIAQFMAPIAMKNRNQEACDSISAYMEKNLEEAKSILSEISLPKGIISNFTGNLSIILDEYNLRPLFHSVTESFYVGVSKPDPKIFREALSKQNGVASSCLYVGDNPVNDISPARALGMRTALIHPPGQKKECGADFYLEDLRSLMDVIHRK